MGNFKNIPAPRRSHSEAAGRVVSLSRDPAARGKDAHPLFDPVYYQRQLPEGIDIDENPFAHFMEEGWRRGCNPHPLFSVSFYLERNPDVALAGCNPFEHYLRYGGAEGRQPHPVFAPRYYLEQRPDAVIFGENPLVHYVVRGYLEDVAPHPLFDPVYYRREVPEVAIARENPLIHFLEEGWRSGHNPHPLFSTLFYLERNPTVAATGCNPLAHYLERGGAAGYVPHPAFDPSYYLEQRPDVASFGADPLTHYVVHGHRENIAPHLLFDPGYYRSQAPQSDEIDVNPLIHFLLRGHLEGISPHALFDLDFYRVQVLDFNGEEINPLVHFILRGHLEGISPHPLFDIDFYRNQACLMTKENPLIHFLREGWRQGYDPHPMFSTSFYLETNLDVAKAQQNPLVHYLRFGGGEGRRPNEWFDAAEYGNSLEHFLKIGIRQGRSPNRHGSSGSLLYLLMCRALLEGDAARAVSQDRYLMRLEGMDRIVTRAGPVCAVRSAALDVTRFRPAVSHILPPVRMLDGRERPAVAASLPAHELSRVEDALAIGGTRLIVKDERLLHDEMSAPESESYGVKIPFVRALCANQALAHIELDRQQIDEGVLLSSDYDFNYFHWMVEALPKLELLEDVPIHVPLLISETVPIAGRTALCRLAKGRRVITLRNFTAYRIKQLYVPSDRSRVLDNYEGVMPIEHDIIIDPRSVDFLRSGLLRRQTANPTRKLFLGRGRRYRALLNESSLGEALAELGYETVDTGAMSLDEQVEIWSTAASVIAPTGAALTNIIFANPATRVLILASDHPLRNPYFFCQIGAQLGLDTTFGFCPRAFSVTDEKSSIHDDYTANIPSVLAWAARQ